MGRIRPRHREPSGVTPGGLIPFEAVADFEGAARLYRRCRQAGVTPRGMVDCMIATVAIRTGSSLLSHDLDLSRIATVVNLELDPASLVR